MNNKIKIELSKEQFTALTQCMLSYEPLEEDDFDKVVMARFILGKVLKKMINRYQDLNKKNRMTLNMAEASAFRSLMVSQISRCGVYEQIIISDIISQIGSRF
jgi:hypothetical protein